MEHWTIPHLESSHYRILGIDPGTETLGVAILDLDIHTGEIVRSIAHTLVASHSPYFNRELANVHGHKAARLEAHKLNLFHLFKTAQPSLIASEAPFYNRFRPNAYAPLVETMMVIRDALRQYDWHKHLMVLDPPRVKKAVGAKGNAKKDEVQAALLKHLKVIRMDKTTFMKLDEHSVDALCVAYAHYQFLTKKITF